MPCWFETWASELESDVSLPQIRVDGFSMGTLVVEMICCACEDDLGTEEV
jgi:hypothetical protein